MLQEGRRKLLSWPRDVIPSCSLAVSPARTNILLQSKSPAGSSRRNVSARGSCTLTRSASASGSGDGTMVCARRTSRTGDSKSRIGAGTSMCVVGRTPTSPPVCHGPLISFRFLGTRLDISSKLGSLVLPIPPLGSSAYEDSKRIEC